ncbi:MAG: elongation factor G [Acidobacteria bacterium]|nr:elongation factor G [Acidobacteriota bacterium]
MKVYEGKDIRNIALAGHGHAGKTQLTAAALHSCGATNRLTRVDEGNTITDFDEESVSRKISIFSSVAAAEWRGVKVNLLDTPGFNCFMNDTRAALHAADAALVVVDGVAGVEVQTEKVWSFAEEFKLPRAIFINKLDRERSSFERTLDSIHQVFGRTCVPIQLPIGSERDFRGVIDLVTMKAFLYEPDGNGVGKEVDIPAEYAEEAQKAHGVLVEAVAEGEDELMAEFFETGTLSAEHVIQGIHDEMKYNAIVPVLCGSALRNIGTCQMLQFCRIFFPAATEHPVIHLRQGDREIDRDVSDAQAPAAFVFKTAADAFQGRVTYFKVLSGVVRNDAHLVNSRTHTEERLAHIGIPFGKTLQPVTELHAGDIGVVAKLKDTLTGDTLADKSNQVALAPLHVEEPSIAYAIQAKSRQDEDRMANAVHKVLEEDLALRFYRDPQTQEFLVAGAGQQHVEIVVSRLRRKYGVDVALKAPKVPYRETIRGFADVQGRHKKQTGGHGQFGDVWVKVEPLPRGGKFEFVNATFGGSVPRNFVPAVEKGFLETSANGYLAGFPMVDFRVTLYDGSYHDVDSSEMSFKMAARKAFKAAMAIAKPVLLEPVMNVTVQAPVEFAGDLMGDLNGRRGRIAGMETKGSTQVIRAQAPMAEMLTYQSDLTSMTQGRASFIMEFDHYDYVPQLQAEKIIAAARAARTGDDEEDE